MTCFWQVYPDQVNYKSAHYPHIAPGIEKLKERPAKVRTLP
jgi:hypothetical protein